MRAPAARRPKAESRPKAKRRPQGKRRPKAAQPLEYNILLTATLCLLAFGAVMVYSASSARTLLQGQGDGTAFLVKYVTYGAIGLVAMHVIARQGLDKALRLTGPLLAASFACLVLVKVPGFGVSVNGARRWLGAGPLQFQPSEIAKLALVLYAAKLLAQKPGRLRQPAAGAAAAARRGRGDPARGLPAGPRHRARARLHHRRPARRGRAAAAPPGRRGRASPSASSCSSRSARPTGATGS